MLQGVCWGSLRQYEHTLFAFGHHRRMIMMMMRRGRFGKFRGKNPLCKDDGIEYKAPSFQ